MLFFFAGVIAILATQSRTGFVAFVVVFCVNYFGAKIKWQPMVIQIAVVCVVSWIFLLGNYNFGITKVTNNELNNNSDYLLSLMNRNALTSSSISGRLRVWYDLMHQFLQKPVFGHAPQKNHFYENHLHADNGYILWAWRYGITGFAAFVAIFLLPVRKIIQKLRASIEAKQFLLVIITFIITNLTNSPLSNTTLSLLFFIFAGVFYCQYYHSKNEDVYQNNT
jgi:O-antigen ligase